MRLGGYLLFILAEGLLVYAAQAAAIRGQWVLAGFAIAFAVLAGVLSFVQLRRFR